MGDNDQISQFLEDMGTSSMLRNDQDEECKIYIKKNWWNHAHEATVWRRVSIKPWVKANPMTHLSDTLP